MSNRAKTAWVIQPGRIQCALLNPGSMMFWRIKGLQQQIKILAILFITAIGFVGDQYIGNGQLILKVGVSGITFISQFTWINQRYRRTQIQHRIVILPGQGIDDFLRMTKAGGFNQNAIRFGGGDHHVERNLHRQTGHTADAAAGDFTDMGIDTFKHGTINTYLTEFINQHRPDLVSRFVAQQVSNCRRLANAEKASDDVSGNSTAHIYCPEENLMTGWSGNNVSSPWRASIIHANRTLLIPGYNSNNFALAEDNCSGCLQVNS